MPEALGLGTFPNLDLEGCARFQSDVEAIIDVDDSVDLACSSKKYQPGQMGLSSQLSRHLPHGVFTSLLKSAQPFESVKIHKSISLSHWQCSPCRPCESRIPITEQLPLVQSVQ